MIKKLGFICIVLVLLMSAPVMALSVSLNSSSSTYLEWSINRGGESITNMSIDGVYVCGVNPLSNTFTLSGLSGGELHTISINTLSTSATLGSYTNSNPVSNQEAGILFFLPYLLIIFCLACLIIGLYVPYVPYIAVALSFTGLITSLSGSNAFLMGTIYMILIVASIYTALKGD
jgi:hypothetical protein